MQTVSVSCPTSIGTFSPIIDVRGLDPASILVKLSKELGVNDTVTIYGTLDSSATSTSVNLTQINTLAGNNGNALGGLEVSGWPFLFAVRTGGSSSGGTVIASGVANASNGASAVPPSATLPALNAYSALIDLGSLAGTSFRVGLSANQTANDTFLLFGTNDSTAGTTQGSASGQALGFLTGGDGTTGTLVVNTPFRYLFVQRLTGSTSGTVIAWGTSSSSTSTNPYASQATWYIDGQNVTGKASDSNTGLTAQTPLLTDQQRASRIGSSVVSIAMTVNLLSSLQATDFITRPKCSMSGFFLVTGSPGATVTHTGTLTGATAQTGNAAPTASDTTISWTTLGAVGAPVRMRITSGPNAGAFTILVHDNGGGVAVCQQPLFSSTSPQIENLNAATLAAGNPYVIEQLPSVPAVVAPYEYVDGTNGSFNFIRYMFEGVNFYSPGAPAGSYVLPGVLEYSSQAFVSCHMGLATCTGVFMGCCWWMFFQSEFYGGQESILLGCSIAGASMYIAPNATVTFDQNTFTYNVPLLDVRGWLGIGVGSQGVYLGVGAGVVSSPDAGIYVTGTLSANYLLWGAGSASYGINVSPGGNASYGTKPTATGTAGDTYIGGTAKQYAAIPFFNATNGAALVLQV